MAFLFTACSISDEEYEGMIEWLMHHIEPLSKVKEYMVKTLIKRAAWVRENPELSIEAIVKEHPRLFDTRNMVGIA